MSLIDDPATCEGVTAADVADVASVAGDALEGWVRDLRSDLAADPPEWAVPGDAEPVDAPTPQRSTEVRRRGADGVGRHRKAE